MRSVIIQSPASSDPDELLYLEPGESLRFGRDPGGRHPLVLPYPGVSRYAGEIIAMDDFWSISNVSQEATYVVENPEGGGEFVKVPPLRSAAPIPFEFARLLLPAGRDVVPVQIYAPGHLYLDPAAPDAPMGDRTISSFPLDTSAKYFLVLVAMCEPRLRDQSHTAIPTAEQIVARLKPLPSCASLNTGAVNFHIDYLAKNKLPLKTAEEAVAGERFEAKRESLVSMAIRFNLVRESHLGLLPPTSRS